MKNNNHTWITFDGKEAKLDTIDHQHLSNCFWFMKIFGGSRSEAKTIIEKIKHAALERFNGQLLPYRPHTGFKEEIKALEEMNMIVKSETESHTHKIVMDGKEIGEIRLFF